MQCPDGTKRSVYRNVESAFPLLLSSATDSIDAGGGIGPAASMKAGAKHSRTFAALLTAVSEENDELLLCFRALYVMYQGNPCGNGAYFDLEMRQLVEQRKRLRTAGRLLTAAGQLIDHGGAEAEVRASLTEAAQLLGSRGSEILAPIAIEDSHRTAKRMIEGSTDA